LASLDRWKKDPRTDQVWSDIQINAQKKHPGNFVYCSKAFAEQFIHLVLGLREIVEAEGRRRKKWEAYRRHAGTAERLAKFLMLEAKDPWDLPHVIPFDEPLARQLLKAAELWRTAATPTNEPGTMRVSRQHTGEREKRVSFMNWMSKEMKEFCGRPMDNEVAVLTEIDQVKSARSPTTRSGRRRSSTSGSKRSRSKRSG
jgi:hypothetical protein